MNQYVKTRGHLFCPAKKKETHAACRLKIFRILNSRSPNSVLCKYHSALNGISFVSLIQICLRYSLAFNSPTLGNLKLHPFNSDNSVSGLFSFLFICRLQSPKLQEEEEDEECQK